MLNSLDDFPISPGPSLEEYLQTATLIEEATDSVIGKKHDANQYPNYYDDMLMKLIDSVPLE